MLKVNDDILRKIGIEYCFLSGNGNSFVHPLELGEKKWNVTLENEKLQLDKMYEFNIFNEGEYIRTGVKIEKIDGKNQFALILIEAEKNDKFLKLKEKINKLQEKIKEWSRRNEERFDVGIQNSFKFGLVKKEQKIIDNTGKELPCAIIDVSFHGIKIITLDKENLQKNEKITLFLQCKESVIIVKTIICNKKVKESITGSGQFFATLNLKLVEENIEYKELVEKFSNEDCNEEIKEMK